MRRLHLVLVVALLASCAGEPESIVSSSTTAVAPSTSSSTSTTSPDGLVEWPSYLVYGWHGVDRVAGAGLSDYREASVQRLTSDPVLWAVEDGVGGIVYRSATDEPGWVWIAAGAEPQVLDLDGGAGVLIPAVVNDGP